uniref:NADH dehydrogenase subunit 2 n=1 Tax=Rabdotus mooreanus TaxID=3014811 RepID=UPI00286CAA45|nr:NADH dehydrogenase subunit 2 [Rabdotus mooreanus]WLN31343.1 NADH dehydrogenase subunit 2 [Rabdotus mooreanus]
MPWVNIIFMLIILLGSMTTLFMSSWLLCWVLMEIMMLGFYPLYYWGNSRPSSESLMKYFLIQSLAATLMLVPGYLWFSMDTRSEIVGFMFVLFNLLKLGVFPFHGWVMPVVYGMGYWMFIWVLGVMKMPSLWFMFNFSQECAESLFFLIIMLSLMSMLVGSMLGLMSTNLRIMLGASSISHSGWMLLALEYGGGLVYIFSYMMTMGYTIYSLYMNESIMTMWALMSFSGLPPFMLFWGKFMLVVSLLQSYLFIPFFMIIILSSVLSLIYYLKFSFFFLLSSSKEITYNMSMSSLLIMLVLGMSTMLYI